MIEAALATAIIGFGVVSMLTLIAAGTAANVDGANQTTAVCLGKNIRELSLQLTYPQFLALNGKTFSPAVDSRGVSLSEMKDWSQTVSVKAANADDLTLTQIDANPAAVNATVTVIHHGEQVTQISWHRFKP